MNSSNHNMFIKILLSYLSVLAIPVLAGVVIYHSALTSVTKLVRDNSHSMLSQSVAMTDIRLGELEALPFYLKSHSDMISVLSRNEIAEGSTELYQVYRAYANFPKFSLINSLIADIQIISLNNDFVISQSNALRLTEQTYPSMFAYTGMDYASFQTYLNDNHFSNNFVLFENSKHEKTPVLLSDITYETSPSTLAVVMIRLKENSLQHILKELLTDQDGLVFILDENNEMITSFIGGNCSLSLEEASSYIDQNSSNDSDYQDYIVSMLQSDYNNWKYCIFSSRSVVMERMASTNRKLLYSILAGLFVSIIFIYFLGWRKTDSLKRVLNYLNGGPLFPSSHDEYSYIADSAAKLINSNKKLRNSLQLQKPLLDAASLRNLLTGAVSKPEELQYLFNFMDIRPDGQYFAVILISTELPAGEEYSAYTEYPLLPSALVREYIENCTEPTIFCLDIDSTKKAAVLIGNQMEKDAFRQQIISFSKHLVSKGLEDGKLTLTCFLSDICSMVDELPQAYRQAVIISQQASRRQGCSLYTAEDIPSIQRFYFYPVQVELELIRLIKRGSQPELLLLLENLRQANFVDRSLSASMNTQLLFAIYGSILRGLDDLPKESLPSKLLGRLQNPASFDELAKCILELNQHITHISTQQNEEKNKKLAQNLLQYINEHYTDCDFSIYHICENFHMSESSAYQIFREVIGTSFTSLVEHMRIERACQLLNEKKLLIKDISAAVGYSNDNSFRRAFKRVMGITPGEYMEH